MVMKIQAYYIWRFSEGISLLWPCDWFRRWRSEVRVLSILKVVCLEKDEFTEYYFIATRLDGIF